LCRPRCRGNLRTQTMTSEPTSQTPETQPAVPGGEPQPSYVKLAMRNMVRKGSKSLFHFTLTTVGLVGFLVGVAYLTR